MCTYNSLTEEEILHARNQCIVVMRERGLSEAQSSTFLRAFDRCASAEKTLIPEDEIEPAGAILHFRDLPEAEPEALKDVAVIRLNGGIGTTMNLDIPKSLIPVRDGMRFIDIIDAQLNSQREKLGVRLPLILLNSDATESAMSAFTPSAQGNLPSSILQNVVPRLSRANLMPIVHHEKDQQWAPPGHGDLLAQLTNTSLLEELLSSGYTTIFIANSDNLGAFPDARLASWMKKNNYSFVAEVVQRTPMDIKGGHFARRKSDGHTILREVAQTPQEDRESFENIEKHRFLNTNNLWINIKALHEYLRSHQHIDLPLIQNHKTVPGAEPRECIQLESALGCAIGLFPKTALIEVERSRFIPVKSTAELLLLRSDIFTLDDEYRLCPQREDLPVIQLDPQFYRSYHDFDVRFQVIPSLLGAQTFTVEGDVTFHDVYEARGECVIQADK